MLTFRWTGFRCTGAVCKTQRLCSCMVTDRKCNTQNQPFCTRTLDGIACVMMVSLSGHCKKAVHGLGNAPRSWWLSVDRFLTSQNGRRTRRDPIIVFFSTDGLGTTYALFAAYVDDFIITGILDQDFDKLNLFLREPTNFRFGVESAFTRSC